MTLKKLQKQRSKELEKVIEKYKPKIDKLDKEIKKLKRMISFAG
jgi:prefoldin subunit 5